MSGWQRLHRAGLLGAALATLLAGCATRGGDSGAPRELAPATARESAAEVGPSEPLVPGSIGQQMTDADLARVRVALDRNGNYEPAIWQGALNGVVYRVTPVRTFTGDGGKRCRDFDTQAAIAGRFQKIRATACVGPDGGWRRLAY